MKLCLTTILSLMVTWFAHAQNFEVVEQSGPYKGTIGQQISAPIKIRNLSKKPIQIIIKRIDQVIGTSQEAFICWGSDCYGSDVNQLPLSKKIDAGDVSGEFRSVLEAGLVEGFSTVRYLIFDRDNPADAIEHEVTYSIEDVSEKKTIFTSDAVRINDVYPNPVVEFAIVDYNLLKDNVKAKIVIHNVLGSIVGEYELAYMENRLKIKTDTFNPGVYFYTLYLDSDGVMTRKLIVRK